MAALKIARNARDALSVLGYFYLNNQKYDMALSILEGLYVICPGDMQTGKLLACARLAGGQPEKALELVSQLLPAAGKPADKTLLNFVQGRALARLGETDRARRILEEVLRDNAT